MRNSTASLAVRKNMSTDYNLLWWTTAVLSGVLVQLLVKYGEPQIVKLLSFTSSKFEIHRKQQEEKYKTEILNLSNDKNLQIIRAIEASYIRSRSVWFLIMSVSLLGLAIAERMSGYLSISYYPEVCGFVGLTSMSLSLMYSSQSATKLNKVSEAIEAANKAQQSE